MKKHFINFIIIIISTSVINTSCEKDDKLDSSPNSLEDITIPIDENSAFNMANFAKSFKQIYSFYLMYKTSISHDIESGKAIYSYQNIDGFGEFGKSICTFTHFYNEEGIIISSERKGADRDRQRLNQTLEYDYYLNGYIKRIIEKHSKIYHDGRIDVYIDTLNFEYNENYQISKKVSNRTIISNSKDNQRHTNEQPSYINFGIIPQIDDKNIGKGESVAIYNYDSDGKLINTQESNFKNEFIYSGNLISQIIYYRDNSPSVSYQFSFSSIDRYNKIEYSNFENQNNSIGFYTYGSKLVLNHYSEENVITSYQFVDNKHLDNYTFFYYYNTPFSISIHHDANCRPVKKLYSEQTENSEFELLGYITIDERNPSEGYYKSHESAFNASNNLVFYSQYSYQSPLGTFEVWSPSYFLPNDDQISIEYIEEHYEWAYFLVNQNNYSESANYVAGNALE